MAAGDSTYQRGGRSVMAKYTAQYYRVQAAASRLSSDVVVPMVVDLVRPASVIDVGCGMGAWLASFATCGVHEIFGVDGDYVDRTQLQIDESCFAARDLTQPLSIDRRFDLVVSLEVAEHLPAAAAKQFVASLVALGPAVLFSAAIPYQGGTGHLNEQWPQYWAALFAAHDYVPVDCLRRYIWNNPAVEWHYAQNILLYVHRDVLRASPVLGAEYARTSLNQLALVHPRKLLNQCDPRYLSPTSLVRWLGAVARGTPTIVQSVYRRRRARAAPDAAAARRSRSVHPEIM
jgi:SAM-dependent methyltransferase